MFQEIDGQPVKAKSTRKPGRPKAEINWELAALCGRAGYPQTEVTVELGVSTETLKTACLREHGIPFAEWLDNQKSHGKVQLRVERFKKALRDNVRLMIWLSRQWFGGKVSDAFTMGYHPKRSYFLPDNQRDLSMMSDKLLPAPELDKGIKIVGNITPYPHANTKK